MENSTQETRRLTLEPPEELLASFESSFKTIPTHIIRVPMRAEILGILTPDSDWNQLSVSIDQFVWMAIAPLNTPVLSIHSVDYDKSIDIRLTALDDKLDIIGREIPAWAEPIAGAAWGLQEFSYATPGIKVAVMGDNPNYDDLAAPVAVNIATAIALRKITNWQIDKMKLVRISQKSMREYVHRETSLPEPFSILFGDIDQIVGIDSKSGEWMTLPFMEGISIVVGRILVNSAEEKKAAEARLETYQQIIKYINEFVPGIQTLRDLKKEEYFEFAELLPEHIRIRIEHVLSESIRVHRAIDALKWERSEEFGSIIDESTSSCDLLVQQFMPKVHILWKASFNSPGRIGGRPLRCPTAPAMIFLVKDEQVEEFIKKTTSVYLNETSEGIAFTVHKTAPMAEIVSYSP